MQGDPRVDKLMYPVELAIKRHVKDSDAATDIYNRAYEAIMNSMDVKDGELAKWKNVAEELAGFMCAGCPKFSTMCATCSAAEIHNRYMDLKGGEA